MGTILPIQLIEQTAILIFINNKHKKNSLSLIDKSSDLSSTDFSIVKNKYAWNTYSSNRFYNIFTLEDLKRELALFLEFYNKNHKDSKYFAILFKIRFTNNDFRTCSTTQIAHIDSIEALYSIFSRIFFIENFNILKLSLEERI